MAVSTLRIRLALFYIVNKSHEKDYSQRYVSPSLNTDSLAFTAAGRCMCDWVAMFMEIKERVT